MDSQVFRYDDLNRLTWASRSREGQRLYTKRYEYDKIGNILRKTEFDEAGLPKPDKDFVYLYAKDIEGMDPKDKPHAVRALSDGTAFEYDANGNMTQMSGGTRAQDTGAQVTKYIYDVENRLKAVEKGPSDTELELVAEYEYDGDGGRTKKIVYREEVDTGTCFLKGTPVTLADGSTRSIEALRIGDEVLSFDEAMGKVVPARVTQTFANEWTDEYVVVNGLIGVTGNHLFYSQGEWREIGTLTTEAKLLGQALTDAAIKSIEKVTVPHKIRVYNIEVAGTNNYFAGGYLVHNKGIPFNFRERQLLIF